MDTSFNKYSTINDLVDKYLNAEQIALAPCEARIERNLAISLIAVTLYLIFFVGNHDNWSALALLPIAMVISGITKRYPQRLLARLFWGSQIREKTEEIKKNSRLQLITREEDIIRAVSERSDWQELGQKVSEILNN